MLTKKAKIFFVLLYAALAIFMWKVAGADTVKIFFSMYGALFFLLVVLPKWLGDEKRYCCCDHQEPNVFMDPVYKNIPGNIYHDRD